jgi:hypothetical protein
MSIFYIKVLVTFYLVQFYKFRQDTERITSHPLTWFPLGKTGVPRKRAIAQSWKTGKRRASGVQPDV